MCLDFPVGTVFLGSVCGINEITYGQSLVQYLAHHMYFKSSSYDFILVISYQLGDWPRNKEEDW